MQNAGATSKLLPIKFALVTSQEPMNYGTVTELTSNRYLSKLWAQSAGWALKFFQFSRSSLSQGITNATLNSL